ncbi:uncharacterized protein TRIVIDRAFT_217162 [Trichoderma virens Gv29-8]|uniref:Uncharacterized protein n=1 Tax=Hypocrea virens (strain Gv29-8 / FGSC 10586) TaxID=413071 RepID=G9NBF7_HYPVG|nr:uncharacterized protein TRIVIDRAFT_217162 [Trichoderma virens Gv29-8]EHK16162.1 hypothetical protein TRIVIDRAFT_217162 [Trichoderma virens Gv29-8]
MSRKHSKPNAAIVNAAVKSETSSQRISSFFHLRERELPRQRRQDILTNANKDLPRKTSHILQTGFNIFCFPFLFLTPHFPAKRIEPNTFIPPNTPLLSRPGLPCMYKKAELSQFVVVTVVSGRQTWGY